MDDVLHNSFFGKSQNNGNLEFGCLVSIKK